MRIWLSALTSFLICLTYFGCAGGGGGGNAVRTISTGSHVPYSDERWSKIQKRQDDKYRFIVWGNHAGATQAAIEILLKGRHTVVERTRLQALFDEQQIRLTHTSDDDARILKVGGLAGANRVLFIEASDKPEIVSGAYVGPYGGASRSSTVHHVSVSVRAVDIETGEVRSSGHSTLTQPIAEPEAAIPFLTRAAMARSVCALERGMEWVEAEVGVGSSRTWGCIEKETN